MPEGRAEKAEEVDGNSSASVGALIGAIAVSAAVAFWVYSGAPPLG